MTVLNAVITEKRAWIAQDHASYRNDRLPGINTSAADYALRPEHMGDMDKVLVFPDQRLLVGGAGTLIYFQAWAETVRETGGDIDALAKVAPEVLRGLLRDFPAPTAEIRILLAGYSETQGKVIGLLFDWQSDFDPQALPSGAVVHSPHLDADAPGADKLEELGASAEHGERVPELFDAMFTNQRWQADHKRIRAGVLLSDGYTLASVDRDGARVVSLPEQLAAAG